MRAAHKGRLAGMAIAAAVCLVGPALAHDSWFAPLPPTDRGEAVFALGTGDRFPLQETIIPWQQLAQTGCRSPSLRATPMRWVADRPTALILRAARPASATAAQTCWAQLKPIAIEIDDATVEVYLKEVNALPAVRQRWEALRARGVRWQESYTKHARVELEAADGSPAEDAANAAIEGLGLDLRIDSPRPLRAGDTLRAQLLRDGQPLAGMPVELRSDLSPIGFWRQTDADGRLQITVPLAARWLLRSVDLQPAANQPDAWDSRFVTLSFEVIPKR
jgi:hypothetical protein